MVKNEQPAGMLSGKFIFERMHMEVEGLEMDSLKTTMLHICWEVFMYHY